METNRYIRTKEEKGLEEAHAHIFRDAEFATSASNPFALTSTLYDMMQFYRSTNPNFSTSDLNKIPAVLIILDQLTWIMTQKNVAPDFAYAWLARETPALKG